MGEKIAVPFTERQMNAIHSGLLTEVQHLRGLLEAPATESEVFVENYLRIALAEAVKLEADFRNFWRNTITADEVEVN